MIKESFTRLVAIITKGVEYSKPYVNAALYFIADSLIWIGDKLDILIDQIIKIVGKVGITLTNAFWLVYDWIANWDNLQKALLIMIICEVVFGSLFLYLHILYQNHHI